MKHTHNHNRYQYVSDDQAVVDRFKYKYSAFITESREFCSYTRPRQSCSWEYISSQSVVDDLTTTKSKPMVAVHLTDAAFDELLGLDQELLQLRQELNRTQDALIVHYEEERARERNPALKMAYDQYKLMLALVR